MKTSGVFLAGAALSPFSSAEPERRTNWSGNYTYSTDNLLQPANLEEVKRSVKGAKKLRALGAKHSFNGIADSSAAQISLAHLDEMVINREAKTVTVGGGVTYSKLAPYLDSNGFAVHNLASLPGVTVAGAIATATHGSGNNNGNLATAVSGLEFVTADGEMLTLTRSKDGDKFLGAVVHLGALGVLTRVTLDILPTFQVRQTVYENLPVSQLEHHLEEVFATGYSVSLFTDWQEHKVNQVWVKQKVDPGMPSQAPAELLGAKAATKRLHPLAGHSAESCTEQLGIPGPWYDRLPHFRIGATPSSGAELQSEFLLPRDRGYEAMLAVEELKDEITPHLFISEVRTVAEDKLWMSTAYGRPSIGIHFTWKPEWPAVKQILPKIEAKLAPFGARPHWGKLFTMPGSQIESQYPQLAAFKELVAHCDPKAKFRNEFLESNVYG